MDNPHFEGDQLLTIDDVAERLNVGERFVRRLVAERRIGYLKVGAKVRFTRDDVEAFVASSRRMHVSTTFWEDPGPSLMGFLESQPTLPPTR
jgi:excisionase family DNA binding protein